MRLRYSNFNLQALIGQKEHTKDAFPLINIFYSFSKKQIFYSFSKIINIFYSFSKKHILFILKKINIYFIPSQKN